mmetsp:Transcript_86849/g.169930  ORF Transcript_86849/g.169930 Transcript_86849/m.169930 type:complete len:83 (-) Transcript_86849:14-262(-)
MSGQQPTAAQQEQYLNQVRQQVQQQVMQDIMTKMTEKCFKLCTSKKGNGLDSSESHCIVNCMDRYMETMQVVTQSLEARQHK